MHYVLVKGGLQLGDTQEKNSSEAPKYFEGPLISSASPILLG